MNEEKLENKLQEIVKNNKPQSITVDGNKKLYISKEKIKKLKELSATMWKQSPQGISQEKEGLGIDSKEGGFLPLLTLLPLIFAGVGAASSVATWVYSAVKSGQKYNSKIALDKEKIEKIKLEKEKLVKGTGIYLDTYQGKAITK